MHLGIKTIKDKKAITIKVREVVTFGAVIGMGTRRPWWLVKFYVLTCIVIMRLFTL